jgi:hypothetical protein
MGYQLSYTNQTLENDDNKPLNKGNTNEAKGI